jgi:hypothetical protein
VTLPAQYGFGGSENPLATNWSTAVGCSGMKESGGVALGSTLWANCGSYWDADVFNANQYVQGIIKTVDVNYTPGLYLRCTATDFYEIIVLDADRTRIRRYNSGAWTTLYTQSGQSNAVGDLLYAKIEGNKITVTCGDSATFNYDDATITDAGAPGISVYGGGTLVNAWDDFEAGNLPPPPGGGLVDDRFRDRRSQLVSYTSTRLRWCTEAWSPRTGILNPNLDAWEDNNSRMIN